MKKMLQQTIQDVVIETINEVDIKSIIKAEIERTTKRVADDLFGNYGDFRKELEAKLKEELRFNLSKLTIPDFGNLAIETVKAELLIIQHDEQERIAKEMQRKLNDLLGTHKEAITLRELQDVFAVSMFEEYIKDSLDSCSCDEYSSPTTLDEVLEILQDENPFTFILHEKEWGTHGRWCTSHMELNFELNKNTHNIFLHVNKENDHIGFYKAGEKNLYKISSIKINGIDVKKDGFVALDMIREDTEVKLVSRFINGALIDATDLACFDIAEE